MLHWAILAMSAIPNPVELDLYIGTYTDPNGSRGIYRARLNAVSGELGRAELVAEATSPSYLCLSKNRKFLYAVNEQSDGEASAYSIEPGGLKLLNTVRFDGKGPCHISLDSESKFAVVSAYGGGTISLLPIGEDGRLLPAADHFKNEGSGPNTKRQTGPHMHYAAFQGDSIYACDLGTDQVLRLAFESKSQKMAVDLKATGKTEPGAGPRHIVVSRDGKHLYANNEMGMSVSVFSRTGDQGFLSLVQTIPTVPNVETTSSWSTAAIKMHPKLEMLYVSNRGRNGITAFSILNDGQLEFKAIHDTRVVEPRDFAIDPSGKWMVVAGQKSGEVEVFAIAQETGLLRATFQKIQISKPVCVVFG
jgi:6-phosphogluconolactonase